MTVHNKLNSIYSACFKLFRQVKGNIARTRIEGTPDRAFGNDAIGQLFGGAGADGRVKTCHAGRLGGLFANTPGMKTPIRRETAETGHPILRGENHMPDILAVKRRVVKFQPSKRRDENRPVAAKTGAKFRRKSLRLRKRASEQQGGVRLFQLPLGIVRHRRRCYLPMSFHATVGNMGKTITILGLESSCDDTAAAVVRYSHGQTEILSSIVFGQGELHADFGGVVPEIAARAHAEKLDYCVEEALACASVSLTAIDAVAVTEGPGLIGGVVAGVMCAKGIAAGAGLPLIGVNHLAGHALTPRLTDGLPFPYLMLLVSGGHCQFLIVNSADDFTRLGGTIDDAPGEAFDKTAKLLGLSQPGGPMVEAEARGGDAGRFVFPRPLLDRTGCDMSFSGLKTALMRARDRVVAEKGGLARQDRADLCAGFQAAVAEVLAEKSRRAIREYLDAKPVAPNFAVAGGVAANSTIRRAIETVCQEFSLRFVAPPVALCTDNAAMISWAGIERFRAGLIDGFDLAARPRWPLDRSQPAMLGSGKKGAKA